MAEPILVLLISSLLLHPQGDPYVRTTKEEKGHPKCRTPGKNVEYVTIKAKNAHIHCFHVFKILKYCI